MTRYDLTNLDGLDPDTRAAAERAARRAGLTLEDWVTAIMADEMGRPDPAPAPRRPQPPSASAVRPQPHFRAPADRRIDIGLMGTRPARDPGSRTAVALESMAMWMEQAEERLNETARLSVAQQDRMADALSQALGSLKSRLDVIERRTAAASARAEAPLHEAMKVLTPLADTLSDLRTDVSQLNERLERAPNASVDEIRGEIERLRGGLEGLATRSEVATLDGTLRMLAQDLEKGPSSKDLLTLTGSVAGLQRQVKGLADETAKELHQRLGNEIDQIKQKVDGIAESGIDRSVVDFLSSQIVDLRHDLALRADPQQIGDLSREVAALGSQLAEIRADQVGRGDFDSLRSSLEDVCNILGRSVAIQEAHNVPEQLQDMNRRLEVIANQPAEAANLDPITSQLTLLTERMASIADGRAEQNAAIETMFGRIESEIRQVGQQADTSAVELMLRSIQEKLDRPSGPSPALDGLERRIADLAEQLARAPAAPAPTEGTTSASLQEEAGRIAERAAKAALEGLLPGVPAAGDLDALKAGFVELKALQTRTDRKTQQTLQAVHEAIETLLARVGEQNAALRTGTTPQSEARPAAERLESAVRRLHTTSLSQAKEILTRSDPLLSEPFGSEREAAQVPLSPAASDQDLGQVRASFIAAARRASQVLPTPEAEPGPFEADRDNEAGEADLFDNLEVEPPVLSLIERVRRAIDANRRPLLFGLAFLILTAGTAQIMTNAPQTAAPVATAAATGRKTATLAPEEATGSIGGMLASAGEAGHFQPSSLTEPPGSTSAFTPTQASLDPGASSEIPSVEPASLRQAALSGDASALYEIASRAADGRGLSKDPALALRLFEKAAQAGLVPARARLGMMYDRGIGTSRDAKLAASWYKRAAEGGNVRAMHNYATLLAAGIDGKPDYPSALQWYKEAAQAGVRDSQFNMGVLYASGIVTRQDLTKAYLWFALASAQGDQEATKRRDEVAARLGPSELKVAKALVERWHPRAVDPAANEVTPPAPDRTAAIGPKGPDRS